MNLSLGFPDPAQERILARRSGLEGTVARFEQRMSDPESPIRAIRRLPAREGQFASMPPNLAEPVQRMLERRGIQRLYTHQAEAFDLATAGKNVVVVTP